MRKKLVIDGLADSTLRKMKRLRVTDGFGKRNWGAWLNYRFKNELINEPATQTVDDSTRDAMLNMWCLTSEMPVITEEGFVQISKISTGMHTLSHSGHFSEILSTMSRSYTGELVNIKTRYECNKLRITPEHPVLAIQTKNCKYHNNMICRHTCQSEPRPPCPHKYYKNYILTWIPAGKLCKNDIVVIPRLKTTLLPNPLKITDSFLDVSIELMRLIGYYIAEGSIGTRQVILTFNKNEHIYLEDVQQLAKYLFPKVTCNFVDYSYRGATDVRLYSASLARFFTQFSKGRDRKLPSWYLTMPSTLQVSLLQGLYRGDGCVDKTRKCIELTTCSEQLCRQIQLILYRLGFLPIVIFKKTVKCYNIKITGSQRNRFAELLGLKKYKKQYTWQRGGWVDESFVYLPISKIYNEHVIDIKVHNLSVKDDESYTTTFVVHNCKSFALNLTDIRAGKTIADLVPENAEAIDKGEKPHLGEAVIVGAGPSIWNHKHLDLLEDYIDSGKYKGIVCATDRMIVPLLERGIIPEISVGVDGSPIIKKFYDHPLIEQYADKLKVVINTTTDHSVVEVLKKFKVPVYWFNPLFDDPHRSNESFTKLQRIMTETEHYPNGVPAITCLSGDTWILGDRLFQIKDSLIGEQVWSINTETMQYEKTRITNVVSNGEKQVFELKTRTRAIKATINHKFMILEQNPVTYYRLSPFGHKIILTTRRRLKISRAVLLKDCISLSTYKSIMRRQKRISKPILLEILKRLSIQFNIDMVTDYRLKYCQRKLVWKNLSDVSINDKILISINLPENSTSIKYMDWIDDDWMRVIGLFIGDGYLRSKRNSIHFCIPHTDKVRVKYEKILEKCFGKISKGKILLSVYSKHFTDFFISLGLNHKCSDKNIPEWCLALSKSQQAALIEGILDSDGHKDLTGRWYFELHNEPLVQQIKMLLIAQGHHVDNVYYRKRKISITNKQGKQYQYNHAESWTIRVTVQGKKPHYYYSDQSCSYRLPSNLAFDIVRSIKPIGIESVYDISVEKNHNFIASAIIVHNCAGNCGAAAWIIANNLLRRGNLALIGIDMGYPEGEKLEDTPYYSALQYTADPTGAIGQFYKKIYNPQFKTYAYVDKIFSHYRDSWRGLALKTSPWTRTVNCTEGGTLFGERIECKKFKEWLNE